MRSRDVIAAIAACAFSLLAASPAISQAASAPTLKIISEANYAPAGHYRLLVHSEKVGRDFQITVTAPPAYVGVPTGSAPGRKLPAIYALDGGYGVAGSIAQMMAGASIMAPAFVISVAYPDGQPNRRNTDLLHNPMTRDGQTSGGGGAAFEAFLTDELRPFLEARYPLDPGDAILFGHSFGGLFAANVLADKPDAFSAYIVGSPSVWADPAVIDRLKKIASKGDGRRVFVAVGGAEQPHMIDGANRVAAVLGGRDSTFKVEKRVFAGEGHLNYYPQLAPAAYEWLLPPVPVPARTAITLPEAAQERLVGDYLVADGRVVGITHKDGKVFIQITGVAGQTEIQAETAQRFFVPGIDVTVTFDGAPTDPPTGLVFSIDGAETQATRNTP